MAAARRLSAQASAAGVTLYFVAASPAVAQARSLARRSGLSAGHVVTDTHDAMGSTYQPVGLTAVLVYKDGLVRSIQQNLGPALQLQGSLRALTRGQPAGAGRPRGHRAAGRPGRAAARLTDRGPRA